MAFAAFGSSAAPIEQAPRRRSWVALVLLAPGLAYLALFFLTPFVSLILTSLQTPVEFGDVGQFQQAFKIENYATVVGQYWPHFLRAFGYALAATFFALVISYPLAYFIGVKARRWPMLQALMLTLVIAPFFISFLLRTLAWKALMSDETPLVQALKALSIIPGRAPHRHRLLRDLRPHLQLHPLHDPADLHDARAPGHAVPRGRR